MQSIAAAGWVQWGRAHPGAVLAALVVLYFAAGKLGLSFAFVHAAASPVWPPSGIALAAVLLFGPRVWPAVFVGALLVNFGVAGALAPSLGIAAGNALEALTGAALVQRYASGVRALDRPAEFLRFVALAGLASTAISATVGVTSLVVAGLAAWGSLGGIWLTWWLGDAAGALIVAPPLLLWGRAGLGPLRERPAEAALLLLVVVATAAMVFAHPLLGRYPLPFLCIPPMIWAAFRFGQREVATAVAILATVATWATVRGRGPFVMASDNESLLLLQAFMATIAVLTLPVAALVWERKAVERERTRLLERERAARAEAESASHARDEFMAMLSHELRNPLAAIANAAGVLQSVERRSGFEGRAVDIIQRQARHLSRLIDDLLDVARVTLGKTVLMRAPLDLAEVVEASLAVLRGGGRLDAHRVAARLAPVWVEADAARLAQVVDNLLVNAIKYTPPGGTIEVQTRHDGDEAVFTVRDTGIGIAPELLPRIFELFAQGPRSLDRAPGGLGVGLTLAHRLVQAHGGRLEAASDGPDAGSVFTVRLPSVPAAAPADVPARLAAESPRRRVLIIEDDADGREALRMQLEIAGHDVYEAASGDEGIETAARVRPEIVLLDIGLPGMDGYQVAERLRAIDGCPRLIALTGYGLPDDHARSASAGIEHHLVKPIDAARLARVLE
jgi:signal transduction histidine kinase/CheY-like chemotaxis protein